MLTITIQLTEKQLKLLEPLRVMVIDGVDKDELGIVIAQIALDNFSHKTSTGQAQRGECEVAFIPNKLATKLIDMKNNFKVKPLDK